MFSSVPGLIPGTRDYGVSELLAILPQFSGLRFINNPAITNPKPATNQISQDQLSNFTFGTNPAVNVNQNGEVLGDKIVAPPTNPTQKTNNVNSATTTNSSNLFNDILDRAAAERDAAISRAGQYVTDAQRLRDQGLNILGQKRDEFQKLFQDTSGDILTGYEGNRGQLQTAAQNEQTRTSNALRALGLGGSAFEKASGRQAQENARALSSLQNQRAQSDRANLNNLNEQNLWANNQQFSLDNLVSDAMSRMQDFQSGANTNYNNVLDQISSQIAALDASKLQNYQPTGINFDPSQLVSTLNNATLETGLTTQPDMVENQNANISPNNSFFDTIIKKLLGR